MQLHRTIVMFRGASFAMVYKKTLTGEIRHNGLAAVTVMSSDVTRSNTILQQTSEVWAHACEIVTGVFLLWLQVKTIAFTPILIAILYFSAQVFLTKPSAKFGMLWSQAIQRRAGQTSSILFSVKYIKLEGLDEEVIK